MSRPGDVGNFDSPAFLVWEEKCDKINKDFYADAHGIAFSYYVILDHTTGFFKVIMEERKKRRAPDSLEGFSIKDGTGGDGLWVKIDFISKAQAKWFASFHNNLFIGEEKER